MTPPTGKGSIPPAGQSAQRAPLRVPYLFEYLLYRPPGYAARPRSRWPLVVFLHGRGERGADLRRVRRHGLPKLIAAGRNFPFIVVSPQCPDLEPWWNVTALDAFITEMTRRYRVDPQRVYLTGLSMGGYGTWALATRRPDRFAAILPICGGGEPRLARRLRRLPIWVFHGARDQTVPLARSRAMVRAIRAAGGAPRFTIYPEAVHDAWTQTYARDDVYSWLLSHCLPRGRPARLQAKP